MTNRIKGILDVSIKHIPGLVSQAWLTYNSMSAQPKVYVAPNPPLSVLLSDINALETAQKATIGNKNRALSKARDAKGTVLILDLEHELAYTQTLADLSPDQAATLLTGAGFKLRKPAVHTKEVLSLDLGTPEGTVIAHCNLTLLAGRGVSKKVTVNWCYSIDGGKTYINLPSTPLAHTTISNLPRLTLVHVKVSVTVSEVVGPWSAPKEIVVS